MSSIDRTAGIDLAIGAGRRLLIIDDEYLVASHLEMVLEDMGFAIVGPVATIQDAMAAMDSEKLDAVMLDANLDGVSSAPIAAELVRRAVPFVVVTGYGHLELASAELNAAPRVHKPFTAASLAVALTGAIGSID